MTFDQLTYFLSVANLKHFTSAADDIAISQSSLSKQISKLEKELGLSLLQRTTRNVSLTPAGEEFYRHAERIMGNYDEMQKSMRTYAVMNAAPSIRLGSSARLVKATLISPMAAFLEECPGVAVSIIEGSTQYIMDMLVSGGIDIALVAHLISPLEQRSNLDRYESARYQWHTVMEDEYYLVSSAKHPFATMESVQWNDLQNERLILLDDSYSVNGMVRRCCELSGFKPNVVFESNQIDAILGMVEANSGHTLMSKQVATTAGFSGITLVPIQNPISRNTVIAYAKGAKTSGHVQTFINQLLKFYPPEGEA